MKLNAMRDVGALVRSARRERGLTQAELAALVGVGREWVVRLEGGNPRVEAQKVLDVLSALSLVLDVTPMDQSPAESSMQPAPAKKESKKTKASTRATNPAPNGRGDQDPFDALFSQKGR